MGAMAEEFLIQQLQQYWGLPTTTSSLRGVQVEENIFENENDEVVIIWEVLRHGLGD